MRAGRAEITAPYFLDFQAGEAVARWIGHGVLAIEENGKGLGFRPDSRPSETEHWPESGSSAHEKMSRFWRGTVYGADSASWEPIGERSTELRSRIVASIAAEAQRAEEEREKAARESAVHALAKRRVAERHGRANGWKRGRFGIAQAVDLGKGARVDVDGFVSPCGLFGVYKGAVSVARGEWTLTHLASGLSFDSHNGRTLADVKTLADRMKSAALDWTLSKLSSRKLNDSGARDVLDAWKRGAFEPTDADLALARTELGAATGGGA